MRLLLRIAVYAAALWVAVQLVDGLEVVEGDWVAFVVIALILAGVNVVVKPVVKLLSLPLVIVSLGLFLLVINALMLQLTVWLAGQLDLGFTSTGFGTTFLGALVVSVVSWIGEALVGE